MTAQADEKGNVSITGIFDADITELLPASWAWRRPALATTM